MQRFFDTFCRRCWLRIRPVCLTGKTKIIAICICMCEHVRTCRCFWALILNSLGEFFLRRVAWQIKRKVFPARINTYIMRPHSPAPPLPTIAISVKRQSLFEFRVGEGVGGGRQEGVWKVVEVKQATSFEQFEQTMRFNCCRRRRRRFKWFAS